MFQWVLKQCIQYAHALNGASTMFNDKICTPVLSLLNQENMKRSVSKDKERATEHGESDRVSPHGQYVEAEA